MRKPWFVLVVLSLLLMLTFSDCGTLSSTSLKTIPHVVARHQPTRTAVPTAQPTTSEYQTHSLSSPIRLTIPAIGVNAAVEKVGILSDGDLATPTAHPWDDTGWYDLGPGPGERGSVVIDGHLDRPGGYPAVFWYLGQLQSGDQVMVTDNLGNTFRYRVMQVASYPPQAAPLQLIFGNNGGSYLNLITCAGDWIPNQHQTTLRLVVYTTLIS